jgi:hypothetical protein
MLIFPEIGLRNGGTEISLFKIIYAAVGNFGQLIFLFRTSLILFVTKDVYILYYKLLSVYIFHKKVAAKFCASSRGNTVVLLELFFLDEVITSDIYQVINE